MASRETPHALGRPQFPGGEKSLVVKLVVPYRFRVDVLARVVIHGGDHYGIKYFVWYTFIHVHLNRKEGDARRRPP